MRMGEVTTLYREDTAGLIIAVALHVGVVALLLLQPVQRPVPEIPDRIAVSLATEVSLEATAPQLVVESRAAIAPEISDRVVPPSDAATSAPDPQNTSPVAPSPATSQPASERERSRPDRTPATPPSSAQPQENPQENSKGSRIGDDFLSGDGSSTTTDETRAPAANFGRQERAALASAITRQLRPHWNAPSGADAEKLESIVTWKLNPDGSLQGRPRCRNVPSSVTDSNRPQAGLHCERAIRAVQLAAPFNLPEPFYNRWKELEWEFNRRL